MRFLIAKHLCNYKEAVLYIGYIFYYKERELKFIICYLRINVLFLENTKARTESKVNER